MLKSVLASLLVLLLVIPGMAGVTGKIAGENRRAAPWRECDPGKYIDGCFNGS